MTVRNLRRDGFFNILIYDLPFSKGGTNISTKRERLLCMKHNLQKSGNIE